MDKVPCFGEIWMCNLDNVDGSVQHGYRPVFILSNDENNAHSPTLNIIPITAKKKKNLPIHVKLWDNYRLCGLLKPSTMLVEQITTISISCLDKYIGVIRDETVFNNISKAIKIQFPVCGNVQC